MQVILVMFRQDGERRSFSITRDVTVIGRREDCDFRIPLGEVSRKHCRLIKDGSSLRLEDLGSSNGTFRNGERVQEAELNPGDTLQVGPVIFVLQIDGVREARVYGEPAGARGDVVAAAVVASAEVTREQIRAWCLAHLSPHKVPRIVKLIESIPVDERGKIKRASLAAL